jgi:hypothetical protein
MDNHSQIEIWLHKTNTNHRKIQCYYSQWWRRWIQVWYIWYIVGNFINVTIYLPHNKKLKNIHNICYSSFVVVIHIKDKKLKKIKLSSGPNICIPRIIHNIVDFVTIFIIVIICNFKTILSSYITIYWGPFLVLMRSCLWQSEPIWEESRTLKECFLLSPDPRI